MRERVFDTSLYKDLPELVRTPVIAEDLAGLVLEAGNLPLEDRINSRRLKIKGGEVIDPVSQEGVFRAFNEETELAKKESQAARSFYSHLVFNPPGSLVVSISPSGGEAGYLEGRVNVGYRTTLEDVEFYGIPTRLSPNTLLSKAILLNEHSQNTVKFTEPEDLREISIPIIVPTNENPWVFLNEVLTLDSDAWIVIRQGKPWVLKEKANYDARPVAEVASIQIAKATTSFDYLYAGATAEQMMERAGWKLNYSGCPGLFNSQILKMQVTGTPNFVKDAFGNARSSEKKYVRRCGKCETKIDNYISKGYRCPRCGGIYEGC